MGISATFWECYGKAGVLSSGRSELRGGKGKLASEKPRHSDQNAKRPHKKRLTIFLIFTDGRSKNHSNGQGRGRQVLFNTAVCQWDVCGCLVQRNH